MSISRWLLLTLPLLPLASLAAAPTTAPATGTVEMRVLDPAGQPVANTRIQFSAHIAPVTDARGIARFQWSVGPQQIFVPVPGRGYGTTGITEVLPGRTAVAPLPRLVPYATVSGTVPNGGGAQLLASEEGDELMPRAVAGRMGHFIFQLSDGNWRIIAQRDGKTFATLPYGLALRPGDQITSLLLRPVERSEPPGSDTQPAANDQPEPREKRIVWARGTIRDEGGHPVAGAMVYGVVSYEGGNGIEDTAEEAVTDQHGHYVIQGGDRFGDFATFEIVAVKSPMPPVEFASQALVLRPWSASSWEMTFPAVPSDVVLAPHGGSLDVAVFANGKPVMGAPVRMLQQGWGVNDAFDLPGDPEVYKLYNLLNPSATTGSDGVAHFTQLRPGLYDISAKAGATPPPTDTVDNVVLTTSAPIGVAKSICVRAGKTTAQRIDLYKMPVGCSFQILRPQGGSVEQPISIRGALLAQQQHSWGPAMATEKKGTITRQLAHTGIWDNVFCYGITRTSSSQHPPYYAVTVYSAASPRLGNLFPVRATARHTANATISIQLLDPAGKPIRGFVRVGQMIGSTDEQGRIEFDQVQSFDVGDGSVGLQAWTADASRREFDVMEGGPWPTDNELSNRLFFPAQFLQARPDEHSSIVLKAQPAGYVRGVFVPASGHPLPPFTPTGLTDEDARIDYHPDTGQFIAGPMRPQSCQLRIWPNGVPNPHPSTTAITIQGGVVMLPPIHLPFPLPTEPAEFDDYGDQRIEAHIYQSDGKTPAYAATLTNFITGQDPGPDWENIAPCAATDAAGRVITDITRNPTPAKQTPARSYLVAMQPGTCGATIMEITKAVKQPLSIALPAPIAVTGKLTFAGKGLAGQTGEFRVLAAYQGKGELNALLSISATPQPDGSFELAGLTPGTYKVQASLDNIWLSDAITVTAEANKGLPAIHLDIPEPGGPAIVHVVSAKGKPLVGVQVMVDRPAGPLTDLDWPASFTSDGAADVWIPALEAGRHTARLKDDPKAAVDFTVPPLPAKAAVAVRLAER